MHLKSFPMAARAIVQTDKENMIIGSFERRGEHTERKVEMMSGLTAVVVIWGLWEIRESLLPQYRTLESALMDSWSSSASSCLIRADRLPPLLLFTDATQTWPSPPSDSTDTNRLL
ncbi:hypothetical protein AOLI_G00211420 [Acnodon oligacanthus]